MPEAVAIQEPAEESVDPPPVSARSVASHHAERDFAAGLLAKLPKENASLPTVQDVRLEKPPALGDVDVSALADYFTSPSGHRVPLE